VYSLVQVCIVYVYPPTPLAAGGARQRRNYKQQGAWREVRFGGLTGASSKEQKARSEEQQGARSKWRGVRFGGLRAAVLS